MKKTISLVICLSMLFFCSMTVSADETGIYENAGQLYEAWVTQGGVPDYISGIWSTDGGSENLTFGVVENEYGEIGRQEILSLVKDDSTVTIVYQTYSRNYLYEIMEHINTYFERDLGLVSAGTNEYENRIDIEVHIDHESDPDTLAMIQELTEQYGDAVSFGYTDSYPELVTATLQEVPSSPFLVMANSKKQVISTGFLLTMCAIVLVFVFLIETQKRRVAAIQTDGNIAVSYQRSISEKDIENTVRKTEIEVSKELDERVMRSISKT